MRTRHRSTSGETTRKKWAKFRWADWPMSMFCGLPIRVAALPMLEAVARAMR